ncbi:3-methylmercaptopropionyl-CoA dehydrogenase [Achromobacter veterisilvae]|uniref:3-methylmercaptopropionyl-CoA dehydrogenase n=1 Tax=Achromobacter veterisilvae TaxID=2069367 RepID=A0A446CS29_9BURK|nr:acyl-CoA dehydrogenase family protein [Achromobacter veterisilvae]SSW70660.1 3-methylmercaptopropionyl-CoA dehydrogenase [Achromobacter veterisilvae]
MKDGLYTAPQRDMQFALYEVLDVEGELGRRAGGAAMDRETLDQILEGADRLCHGVLAPLNASGDREGCRLEGHEVRTPAGFGQAYRAYAEGGWPGLCASEEHGGQALPTVASAIVGEMLGGSNISFALYPRLSEGAYRCIRANATAELQAVYGPKLASGEWTGTMCLTEAQAGTDLGLLRTKAVPDGDGAYRISGGKVFISSGEHDLAPNIVHMVLARLPDAPAGTRGISLFLVPKFLPDAGGRPGERNGVYCDAIEHKLGLHANATCVLRFENAKGYLVGEANKGLAAMFVMMNSARLGTGAQALGLTETALQKSLAYAAERLQSRAPGQEKAVTRADPILLQPDVRRMLLTQQAWAQGARMFLYWLALQIDAEQHAGLAAERDRAGGLLSLLTPVAKAFVSDNAVESVNLAVQVHGGSGYIVESGIEQTLRDVRILPIYEGTNGVQAHDLLARKVLADQGGRLAQLLALARGQADSAEAVEGGAEFGRPLRELADRIEEAVPRLATLAAADPAQVGASASDFLRIVGHLVYGYFWSRAALAALTRLPAADPLRAEKLATARFYFEHLFPETEMRLRRLFVPAERFTNPRALAA